MVKINENEEKIEDACCHGCAAAQGGCKHAIAFLMWLHRRSEEPSPTEVESYWRKSKLSALGSEVNPLKVRDMTGSVPVGLVEDGSFRREVINALEEHEQFESGLISLHFHLNVKNFAIHQMLLTYQEIHKSRVPSPMAFLIFAEKFMQEQNLCETVYNITKTQHTSALWHQLRLGRISASRAHEVMHCQKKEGVLVDMIVGTRKIKDSSAMKRGRELESEVIRQLERELGHKIERYGLALDPEYPFLGATPDGLFEETLVEIKCPQKASTEKSYVKDGMATMKYETQMMVLMLLLRKKQCLFAVADPQFESSKKIFACLVKYNESFANDIVNKCKQFWCETIFPLLNK